MRYFQDDDNVGLKEMVRREKMSSAQDQNALYSRMAAKVRGNDCWATHDCDYYWLIFERWKTRIEDMVGGWMDRWKCGYVDGWVDEWIGNAASLTVS